jgi:hypothetical protein
MDKENYVSNSFQGKIQVSLANISRSSEDKFSIVSMEYIPQTFKCELCGHSPCLYAFNVKNQETDKTIKVGSECVNHFRGECDIDIAEGLKKRIKSVTRKMKRYLKKYMDKEDYKSMSKERKREITVELFMRFQNKEILRNENQKKSRLTKEDVEAVLRNNLH